MTGPLGNPHEIVHPGLRLSRVPSGRPLWLSYTIPWPDVPLLSLLGQVQERPRFYWSSSAHPVSLVGWGKALELTDWGERRFRAIQSQVEHFSTRFFPLNPDAPAEVGPRWLGGFSFQSRPIEEPLWQAFPEAYFVLPRLQLASLDGQVWLTINHLVEDASDTTAIQAYFDACLQEVNRLYTTPLSEKKTGKSQPVPFHASLSEMTWQAMVAGALQHIQQGSFEKVVLARTLQARLEEPLSIVDILERLAERYPDCYRFMLEPEPGQVFLGASPELLAEVSAPGFRSAALAGTIRRGNTPAEDARLGQALLDSAKDRLEHAIVVRAIQGKLESLAETLEIAPAPTLRRLGNLQHLETAISGQLAPGWGVLDVAAALHPTPALGGWPQQPAQDYLTQAEPFSRGWYAAPIGWVDPWGNGIFAVAIRSGLISRQSVTLFAGAGIVGDSQPVKEWQETGLKFRPLLDAIGGRLPYGS